MNGPVKRAIAQQRDPKQWEELIAEFAPAIRYIAQRLAFRLPPSLDVEDLIHAGVIGLMDALGKYDPSRKARFKTYAEFRIRGAMLDEIRSLDWVPRSVREKIGLLRKTLEQLEKRLGRFPTEEEIARELDMSIEECGALMLQARGVALVSLDDLGLSGCDPRTLLETLVDARAEDPFLSLLQQEARDKLMGGVHSLPEKEQQVVSLYYHDELTLKEIGQILGITESRVCQLHAQAIMRLKTKLNIPQQG
ncbi:MAG TPA: FliA/WhiG family RNA polymerase sigma factor [Nitrospiria bacterium]|nr:FliA/WhiG family RNA polymerase sigma factor [Nitrospiria bacterium]